MTSTVNISLLGQSTAQTSRLIDMRRQLDDLTRQVATQQKSETYSGLGTDAIKIQYLNKQEPLLQSYLSNINDASNNMTMMNNALGSISQVGTDLINSIQTLLRNGTDSLGNIKQIVEQGLKTVQDMINQNINGRYLFAGSEVGTPPFIDDSTLNSNFITQITNWLASGDTDTLAATVDGFSPTNLGLSPGLASSGNVTTRISDNINIDYTLRADDTGFQNLIRGLTLISNLSYPSSTDVATPSDFTDLMNYALEIVQSAVEEINDSTQQLAGKFNLLNAAKKNHTSDLQIVQTQISAITSVDSTDALVRIQALQTQLSASYQVTNIVSQMSLVNFL